MHQASYHLMLAILIVWLQGTLLVKTSEGYNTATAQKSYEGDHLGKQSLPDYLSAPMPKTLSHNSYGDLFSSLEIPGEERNNAEKVISSDEENESDFTDEISIPKAVEYFNINDQLEQYYPYDWHLSFNLKNKPFFDHYEKRNKLLSYNWGPNPMFWWPVNAHSTQDMFKIPSKENFHPIFQKTSFSGWESNPSFWGKRNFWTARGKKESKHDTIMKLFAKSENNVPSFWKSRGKRDNTFTPSQRKLKTDLPNASKPWILEELGPEPSYWTNRGKKITGQRELDETKRSNFPGELLKKYWTSRGRRRPDEKFWESETKDSAVPHWFPRGKKPA